MSDILAKSRVGFHLAGLVAGLALFQFASVAPAAPLYLDSFNYVRGYNNLVGQNRGHGWAGPWAAPTSQTAADAAGELESILDVTVSNSPVNPPRMVFTPTNNPTGQFSRVKTLNWTPSKRTQSASVPIQR